MPLALFTTYVWFLAECLFVQERGRAKAALHIELAAPHVHVVVTSILVFGRGLWLFTHAGLGNEQYC